VAARSAGCWVCSGCGASGRGVGGAPSVAAVFIRAGGIGRRSRACGRLWTSCDAFMGSAFGEHVQEAASTCRVEGAEASDDRAVCACWLSFGGDAHSMWVPRAPCRVVTACPWPCEPVECPAAHDSGAFIAVRGPSVSTFCEYTNQSPAPFLIPRMRRVWGLAIYAYEAMCKAVCGTVVAHCSTI